MSQIEELNYFQYFKMPFKLETLCILEIGIYFIKIIYKKLEFMKIFEKILLNLHFGIQPLLILAIVKSFIKINYSKLNAY